MPAARPNLLSIFVACVVLSACSGPVAEFPAGEACEAATFTVADNFGGARRGDCEVFTDSKVRIHITPEDPGDINNSPWYSFRLLPKTAGTAHIDIDYHGGDPRYWPKWSDNGTDWQRIPENQVSAHWFKPRVSLHMDLEDRPIWISGQELILPSDMDEWSAPLLVNGQVQRSVLGKSGAGEDIQRLDVNPQSREVVFLAGRQHPPELTGAIAFLDFYEELLADNDMANAFRERFHVIALPMLNPDGVLAGHWRHNLNGVDLNRDWGSFSEPETQLVAQLLDELDALQKQVLVSVDFHSTARNVMYTQMDEDLTTPVDFSGRWIDASLARLPDYEFSEEPRPMSELGTSRNYMYKRYRIPAVTYEVGDEENRETIRHAARIFAQEFMRLLNETPTRPLGT